MSRRIRLLLAVVLSVVVASGVYRFRWGVLGLAGLGPPSGACEEVETLETYLRAGGSPSAYVGRKPLIMCATEAGSYEVVARLIELGVDVDAPKKGPYIPIVVAWDTGITSLFVAVFEDYFEIAELLFNNGADVSWDESTTIHTPLDLTFTLNRSKYLELFLRDNDTASKLAHIENGYNPIADAASDGHIELFKVLLKEDIWLERLYEQSLIEAASEGHIMLVKLLLEEGVSVDAVGINNLTALHLSARAGHTNVVQFLVNAGAKIDVLDDDGKAPLDYASELNHSDIIGILLRNGASVDTSENRSSAELK